MSAPRTVTTSSDLVPLADRLRYLQGFRVVIAVVVMACAALAGERLEVPLAFVAAITTGYLVATLVALLGWQVSRTGAARLFGLVVMFDGVFLAWSSYVTGGSGSPVRYLIVLHLIAVALLASYRTGMKLAMWHSLLLLVVFYAQQAELLRPLSEERTTALGTPLQQLLIFSAVFWLVAIVTASFSAVNERELRRRRYDLEALAVMARRMEEATGSVDAGEVLVDTVVDTFAIDRAVVLANPDGRELAVLAAHGEVAAAGGIVRPAPGSILDTALRSGRTHLSAWLRPDVDRELDALLPGARNVVVVPLTAGRHPLGVLVAEHPLRAGSRIERRVVGMLERFAAHAALALRNAWLLEEIRDLAASDPLTGLANRATFQLALGRELSRARRDGQEVALAMLDIDHFKRLNDTHGHLAGDEVLRGVSAVLEGSCRTADIAARYGGEEFAVILPATGAAEAREIAERLRIAVAAAPVDPGVTVSVGVAVFPRDGDDADGLLKAADDALYASKRAGRDCVTVA